MEENVIFFGILLYILVDDFIIMYIWVVVGSCLEVYMDRVLFGR